MADTIYIDKNTMPGAFGVTFSRQEITMVFTGLEVHTEKDEPILAEISRLCGLDFFSQEPEVPLYSVPCLQMFASDGRGGWLAGIEDLKDGPVYHIAQDRKIAFVTEHFSALFNMMVSDPDWRQKYLPGDWPPLPEDRSGRQKLAEALHLPCPVPEEIEKTGTLPRVFASREEAAEEFPIQDIWTILRQKKTPRFQVHPMMSPADREGRAFVHYQSWQETYPGLMPESILAGHTLERCQKIAEKGDPDTNFVLLDRENGDRVVGFATISLRARDFVSVPEAGEVIALYVLKEYQGFGLGKQLMEHCISRLPHRRIVLLVLDGNEKAIGFYKHMGFHFTGHSVVDERNGAKMTELEMVLERETANE